MPGPSCARALSCSAVYRQDVNHMMSFPESITAAAGPAVWREEGIGKVCSDYK